MARQILFSILFLFNLSFFSQNKEVDSLLVVLKTEKEDTNKVNLLNQLSEKAGLRIAKYDKALEYAESAEKLAEKLSFKKGMANSYHIIGIVYTYQLNYAEALKNYLASIKIKEEIGDKKGMANSYNNIGTVYKDQSNNLNALKNYFASLKINTEIGDKKGIIISYNNIGNVYLNQGNFTDALKNYYAALKTNEVDSLGSVWDKIELANSYNNIALIYHNQGNYTDALKNHLTSLKIKEDVSKGSVGDKKRIANSYNNIGNAYSNQGNNKEAVKNYLKSLKLYEEIGDKKGIAIAYNNIGGVYKEQGNYSDALKSHFTSLKIREEIRDKKGIASSYSNIGTVYKSQGNYKDALRNQIASLEIREEIGDKKGIASSYCNIGTIYLNQGNYEGAYDKSKKALDIAFEIGVKFETKMATENLYKICTKIDSLSGAVKYIGSLIALCKEDLIINYTSLSEQEKELYFATIQEDFDLQYDLALSHPDLNQQAVSAYNNALLTKGLSLRSFNAMRTAILSSGDTLLIGQYDEWLLLKRQISKSYEAGKDVLELEKKANELERDLVKKSTVFSDFDKAKNLDWKQVQASLKPKEAAIEFVHFKSEIDSLHPIKYAALIIKTEGSYPEIISLCDEKDIEKILGTFQGNNLNYINSVYGTKKEASLGLYDKVWKPMEKSLEGVTTIYYSPSGLLHKISFSALSSGKNAYLCDKYNLNRESSTGKVALPDNINYLPSDKIALIGGVKYNSDTTKKEMWTYLPGTLTEAEEINKLLKTKKHTVNYLASVNANEANFKKDIPQAEILHVATHGFFFPDPEKVKEELKVTQTKEENLTFRGTTDYANWSFVNNKNPLMRSGIVLAGANDVWERDPMAEGEDGVLTAQEVSNMDMRKTKLVVLSACETGLGDIKGSEGVYGLQRAFKMAGVNYIVMSLWQVPDKETSEFMISFYKKLTSEKDIKKAFHATQKEMRKKYDPYYWAAFVLVE
ncbi:MAG: CHAT domain-containing protein [Bacteroidetes bacterium]|nr:CHAT domain-containing protein [Bacteroidota bacterium]